MSSISALQATGLDAVSPAKPVTDTAAAASTSSAAAPAVASQAAVNYPSPVFALDPGSSRVIFEYRDKSTGQVTEQLPSKDAVRLYEVSASQTQQPAKSKIST